MTVKNGNDVVDVVLLLLLPPLLLLSTLTKDILSISWTFRKVSVLAMLPTHLCYVAVPHRHTVLNGRMLPWKGWSAKKKAQNQWMLSWVAGCLSGSLGVCENDNPGSETDKGFALSATIPYWSDGVLARLTRCIPVYLTMLMIVTALRSGGS